MKNTRKKKVFLDILFSSLSSAYHGIHKQRDFCLYTESFSYAGTEGMLQPDGCINYYSLSVLKFRGAQDEELTLLNCSDKGILH